MNFSQRLSGFALIVSLPLAGCGKSQPAAQAAAGPTAFPVGIQVVQASPVNDSSEYVATLKSRASSTISPQVAGQITHIFVKSGDHVRMGAPLMEIDPQKQQATVAALEKQRQTQIANVRWAKQQLDRVKKLAGAGVVAQQDLDQAQTNYDAAQATLESLESQIAEQSAQLRYHHVSAPMEGIVGDVPVHVGDSVTTTTVLTTVDKPGALEAYISIPIERAPAVKLGQPVEIVDVGGAVLADSRITFISPEVNNQTQSVLVKAQVGNAKDILRTSQFIRARVIWGAAPRPLVPVLAVSRLNGQPFVFVAEGGDGQLVAHQKPVHLGVTVGNNYVVLDGLKPGDKLIVSGMQILADGMPVTPVTQNGSQSNHQGNNPS